MRNLKQELEERWLLYQLSNESLFEEIENKSISFYCGFDPTSDSLHLWNLIGLITSLHLMFDWHKCIALTGWATWRIWDMSGKTSERKLLTQEQLLLNESIIRNQINNIFSKLDNKNYDYEVQSNGWYLEQIEWLLSYGKYLSINNMLSKKVVKEYNEDSKVSMNYAEFSYMFLQAIDFCKLYVTDNVTLQIGWQDQWGNMITWKELIKKKHYKSVDVFTWSLLNDSNGKKFGKSEWNSIWLDKNKTSPYKMYQYFMNTSDADLHKYLKMLTFVSLDNINSLMKDFIKEPEKRLWQKFLWLEVVSFVHWDAQADIAVKITDFIYWEWDKMEKLKSLNREELVLLQNEIKWYTYTREKLISVNYNINPSDLLMETSMMYCMKFFEQWKIKMNWEFIRNNIKHISSPNWFIFIEYWKTTMSLVLLPYPNK